MHNVELGYIKRKMYQNCLLILAFTVSIALILGVIQPYNAAAQSSMTASIRVNGVRSTTLPYGSNAAITWTTTSADECLVTPGDWKDLQGNVTLNAVTAKQTYKLSCKSQLGIATAYATFAVTPPTYDYLKEYLRKSTAATSTDKGLIKGILQQINEAKKKDKRQQFEGAKKILDKTVTKLNKQAERGGVSTVVAAHYAAAVNNLTSSRSAATPTPDAIPDDSVVLAIRTDNGGYPSIWANAPMNAHIDNWGMYSRQSVSYAAFKVEQTYGNMPYWGGRGEANQWDDNARAAGIKVSTIPEAGTVAILNDGTYGHAAWVESVNADGTINISHYNVGWTGSYAEWFNLNPNYFDSYIYFGRE